LLLSSATRQFKSLPHSRALDVVLLVMMFMNFRNRVWLWYYREHGQFRPTETTEEHKKLVELWKQRADLVTTNGILRDCLRYEIDLEPYLGDEYFYPDKSHGSVLTLKGRSSLRKLIREEKQRRSEDLEKWIKLLVPIITGVAGLLGIITGLVAVLHRKP
jgi:hypothetical protein